jgi:transposase
LATVLRHLSGLRLLQATLVPDQIVLEVAARRSGARCPSCRRRSRRVHSRYVRRLSDEPIGGRRVAIRVRVRRFRCTRPDCARRTFAERIPTLAARSARRTVPLDDHLRDLGVTLGGRPGARFAARRAIRTSRTTLIRLVRATPAPAVTTPEVLGVDDFALRRGHRYGTVVVDLERRRPVDLLDDRTAATFAAWLGAHGAPAVVCRDRGGAYADGARQGAPDAVQVADRFHLLRNAADVLERVLTRHGAALRATVEDDEHEGHPGEGGCADAAAAQVSAPASTAVAPRAPRPRQDRYRVAHEAAVALLARGWSVRASAREVGLARATLAKYLRAGAVPERPPRRTRLSAGTDHGTYLQARWAAGCRDATALWTELRARGFAGSRRSVQRAVAAWRAGARRCGPVPMAGGRPAQPAPERLRPPSPRQAVWLLLRPEAEVTTAQRAMRARLLAAAPEVGTALARLDAFRAMIRERDRSAFAPWLEVAADCPVPEVRTFAASLRRDEAAVDAALTYPWSSGPVEGQVTRLKGVSQDDPGRSVVDGAGPGGRATNGCSTMPAGRGVNRGRRRAVRRHPVGSLPARRVYPGRACVRRPSGPVLPPPQDHRCLRSEPGPFPGLVRGCIHRAVGGG